MVPLFLSTFVRFLTAVSRLIQFFYYMCITWDYLPFDFLVALGTVVHISEWTIGLLLSSFLLRHDDGLSNEFHKYIFQELKNLRSSLRLR